MVALSNDESELNFNEEGIAGVSGRMGPMSIAARQSELNTDGNLMRLSTSLVIEDVARRLDGKFCCQLPQAELIGKTRCFA